MRETVAKSGKDLLATALKAIGGAAPRQSMPDFSDILFSMCQHCFAQYSAWLNELKHFPDIPCVNLEHGHKDRFFKQIVREVKSKRKFRDIIKEFTLVCRGMHGTDYAAG